MLAVENMGAGFCQARHPELKHNVLMAFHNAHEDTDTQHIQHMGPGIIITVHHAGYPAYNCDS